MRTILEAWEDRIDSRLQRDLFWIDPVPPSSPMRHVVGHVIVVQAARAHSTAVLLSGVIQHEHDVVVDHTAVLVSGRLNAAMALDLLPLPSSLRAFPHQVRYGPRPVPFGAPLRVGSGDLIVIEVDARPSAVAPEDHDETSTLQYHGPFFLHACGFLYCFFGRSRCLMFLSQLNSRLFFRYLFGLGSIVALLELFMKAFVFCLRPMCPLISRASLVLTPLFVHWPVLLLGLLRLPWLWTFSLMEHSGVERIKQQLVLFLL